DVHGHELRAELAEPGDRVPAVAGLADDLVAALGVRQDVLDHGAHEHRVIHDQNPDRHQTSSSEAGLGAGWNPLRTLPSTRDTRALSDSTLRIRAPIGRRACSHDAAPPGGGGASRGAVVTSTSARDRMPRWS